MADDGRLLVVGEGKAGRGAKPLGEFVRAALADPKVASGVAERQVALVWRDVVGEAVASHARPAGVRRGVLTVVVDEPTRAHEYAAALRREVVRRLNERLGSGAVKDVRFRSGGRAWRAALRDDGA